MTIADVYNALAAVNSAGQNIDFVAPLTHLMSAILVEKAKTDLESLENVRLALLIAYVVILTLVYLLLLYPTAQALSEDASKMKSLMLLVPIDALSRVPAIQLYIQEKISLE